MTQIALVRYGEIGTKSKTVQKQMVQALRQRVEKKIENKGLEYEKVSQRQGRIIAYVENAEKTAEVLQHLPGIKTVSPAKKAEPDLESIKKVSEKFSYGKTFGVNPNTGHTELSTPEIAKEIGAHVEKFSGAQVDLDNPDTWLGVDVREDEAYLFTQTLQGPGGFPAGTQGNYAALISGGIDSPVAAYKMMTRGADITPVYFYNKPIAAEDHLMRFKASVSKLKKFHSEKKWNAYIIDMGEVNKELMNVGRGRMVLHRKIMFRVAEKIAKEQNFNGIVTGESLGQKSSQTAQNLELTSSDIKKPIMRPLLTMDKNSISEEARKINTFEEAEIDSACRSLSPKNPATELGEERLENIEETVEINELVEKAYESLEIIEL